MSKAKRSKIQLNSAPQIAYTADLVKTLYTDCLNNFIISFKPVIIESSGSSEASNTSNASDSSNSSDSSDSSGSSDSSDSSGSSDSSDATGYFKATITNPTNILCQGNTISPSAFLTNLISLLGATTEPSDTITTLSQLDPYLQAYYTAIDKTYTNFGQTLADVCNFIVETTRTDSTLRQYFSERISSLTDLPTAEWPLDDPLYLEFKFSEVSAEETRIIKLTNIVSWLRMLLSKQTYDSAQEPKIVCLSTDEANAIKTELSNCKTFEQTSSILSSRKLNNLTLDLSDYDGTFSDEDKAEIIDKLSSESNILWMIFTDIFSLFASIYYILYRYSSSSSDSSSDNVTPETYGIGGILMALAEALTNKNVIYYKGNDKLLITKEVDKQIKNISTLKAKLDDEEVDIQKLPELLKTTAPHTLNLYTDYSATNLTDPTEDASIQNIGRVMTCWYETNFTATERINSEDVAITDAKLDQNLNDGRWITERTSKDELPSIKIHWQEVAATCLSGNTLITMSTGRQKRIIEIMPGDYVRNKYGKPSKVVFSDGHLTKFGNGYTVYSLSNGEQLEIIKDHRCYSPKYKCFKHLSKLKVGDNLIDQSGKEVFICKIEKINKPIQHYTIFTADNCGYYANGILAGNIFSNIHNFLFKPYYWLILKRQLKK